MNFNWSKILSTDESLEKEFSISNRYRNILFSLTTVASLLILFFNIFIAICIFLLGLLYWFYLKKAKHYGFTNKRIVLVDSFLGETITSIDYNQITDIEIEQNFLDQIAGWGTLIINTAGTHVPEINLTFIGNPQDIKQTLDKIRDNVRSSTPVIPFPAQN